MNVERRTVHYPFPYGDPRCATETSATREKSPSSRAETMRCASASTSCSCVVPNISGMPKRKRRKRRLQRADKWKTEVQAEVSGTLLITKMAVVDDWAAQNFCYLLLGDESATKKVQRRENQAAYHWRPGLGFLLALRGERSFEVLLQHEQVGKYNP